MGGGTDSATKAAQKAEDERRAQAKAATSSINGIFNSDSRKKQIADFLSADRTLYRTDLDKQKHKADLNTKFAMARSGLTGGSQDVDANADITNSYNKGLIDAERRAQGAASELSAADQQARLNLISMAQNGLDNTTGQQQSLEALQSNLSLAKQKSATDGIADVFASLTDWYKKSQQAKEARQTTKYGFGSLYAPMDGNIAVNTPGYT